MKVPSLRFKHNCNSQRDTIAVKHWWTLYFLNIKKLATFMLSNSGTNSCYHIPQGLTLARKWHVLRGRREQKYMADNSWIIINYSYMYCDRKRYDVSSVLRTFRGLGKPTTKTSKSNFFYRRQKTAYPHAEKLKIFMRVRERT